MPGLILQFTKRADGRSVLRCIRPDGSVTWQRHENERATFFPLHDLIHFAVESELRFERGFYGLIAAGWNMEETTGKTTRGCLPDEAIEAEHIVGVLGTEWNSEAKWSAAEFNEQALAFAQSRGIAKPRALTEGDLARVRTRVAELFARWRDLEPGGTMKLLFEL